MAKLKMELELEVLNRNPTQIVNLSGMKQQILNALLDHFNEAPPKTDCLVTSVKISNLKNKKFGIYWRMKQ